MISERTTITTAFGSYPQLQLACPSVRRMQGYYLSPRAPDSRTTQASLVQPPNAATTIPTRRLSPTILFTTLGTCAAKLAKTKAYMHTFTDRPFSCLQRQMLARHRSCQSLHIPPHLLPTQRVGKNEGIHAPVLATTTILLPTKTSACMHTFPPAAE